MPVVGQLTNVGDTLHRSVLIEWLSSDNKLHLYVGAADSSFLSGLYVNNKCVFYKNFLVWYFCAIFRAKKSAFFYNPGEITGSVSRFLKETTLWPLFIVYKIFGSAILKVGIDVRGSGKISSMLYKLSNLFTNISFYRTLDSYDRFGRGEVIPDLGFYRLSAFNDENSCERKYICISMRADKPLWSKDVFSKIVEFSHLEKLDIYVVVQVKSDNVSARQIASQFSKLGWDINICFWNDDASHAEQEKMVNEIYKKSVLVISDRLHVLIASANNGAVPLCLAPYFSHKIRNHFEVIGYGDNVFDINDSCGDVKKILTKQLNRTEKLASCLNVAKLELEGVKERIRALIWK
jgi:hypothetical protein